MSVDIKNLEECIAEAKRFIGKAISCRHDLESKAAFRKTGAKGYWPDTRLTAAVRRSSMDLTRALAALRDYRR